MKYHIDKDGSLIFPGLKLGTLNGEPLTWDRLRELVILSTRFAMGRNIESRTLQEFTDSVTAFVKERSQSINQDQEEIKKLKRNLHNAWQIIESLENQIGRQNQEINELRKQYIEAARASAARQQTA